ACAVTALTVAPRALAQDMPMMGEMPDAGTPAPATPDGADAGTPDGGTPDAAEPWRPGPPDQAQLRGLPLCPPGYVVPETSGTAYTCRPAWNGNTGSPSFEFAFAELGLGGVESSRALSHSSFAFAVPLYLWLGHDFGIGARYEYTSGGAREYDLDRDGH